KEQLVMLRPHDGLLVMSVLNYSSQVTPASAFEEEIPKGSIDAQELELAKTLIKASAKDKPDLTKYKDIYTEKLATLIEAKVAGQEVVSPPPREHVQVINLMDALKKSVAQIEGEEGPGEAEPAGPAEEAEPKAKKPSRKMAPSKGTSAAQTRKKKSS